MPRPPRAKEKVLDAFESIIISDGTAAATLDATAREAGVSKGGLLYHFGSKEALVAGLLQRLERLVVEDLERMRVTPEGSVAYFVRTSVMEDADLDRALTATSRLAQGGSHAAGEALRRTRTSWADALRPHVRDQAALDLVLLVGDGLYFNNSLDVHGSEHIVPTGDQLMKLIELVVSASTPQ